MGYQERDFNGSLHNGFITIAFHIWTEAADGGFIRKLESFLNEFVIQPLYTYTLHFSRV